MKKINSIDYGGKVIGIGCIFAFLLPIILYFINLKIESSVIQVIGIISLVIGVVILIVFFLHLAMELHQDKKIDRYYSLHRNIKRPIKNGWYECGSCGNRRVGAKDKQCSVCGIHFKEMAELTPQEIIDAKSESRF